EDGNHRLFGIDVPIAVEEGGDLRWRDGPPRRDRGAVLHPFGQGTLLVRNEVPTPNAAQVLAALSLLSAGIVIHQTAPGLLASQMGALLSFVILSEAKNLALRDSVWVSCQP